MVVFDIKTPVLIGLTVRIRVKIKFPTAGPILFFKNTYALYIVSKIHHILILNTYCLFFPGDWLLVYDIFPRFLLLHEHCESTDYKLSLSCGSPNLAGKYLRNTLKRIL
jgi:hypothetical protein